MERRNGKLTGPKAADCTVTISKMDGVEFFTDHHRSIAGCPGRALHVDRRWRTGNEPMAKGQGWLGNREPSRSSFAR